MDTMIWFGMGLAAVALAVLLFKRGRRGGGHAEGGILGGSSHGGDGGCDSGGGDGGGD